MRSPSLDICYSTRQIGYWQRKRVGSRKTAVIGWVAKLSVAIASPTFGCSVDCRARVRSAGRKLDICGRAESDKDWVGVVCGCAVSQPPIVIVAPTECRSFGIDST